MSKFLKSILLLTVVSLGVTTFYNKKEPNIETKESQNIIENQPKPKDTNLEKSDTKSSNNNKESKSDNKDYSVLVSSNDYNAVVSLDEDTKKINIKVLEDPSNPPTSDNYINLSEEDIKYLQENADKILSELKEGNLSEKYKLVTAMLEKYDTNINISDLINLGLKYIQ